MVNDLRAINLSPIASIQTLIENRRISMEIEKVKEIKEALEQNDDNGIMYEVNDQKRTCKFIHCKDILTLINELESENEALQKGVKRLKKRYEETVTKNADECVKKFCETTMYHEQEKLINENQQLKDRIADLEKENTRLDKVVKHFQELIEDGKLISSEQLKQFAERLKVKTRVIVDFYADHPDKSFNGISEKGIDETLEEFLNR